MMGMRADIAGAADRTGPRRIGPPRGLLVIGGQRLRQPVLDIFDMDLPDDAEGAVAHHGPRLAHHRIGGEGVGDAEHQAAAPTRLDQVDAHRRDWS